MRRYFALLAATLLSGCGLTDGPNRTGSAWLDELDLGPQGLESVSIPVSALDVRTILDPAVPALNGMGNLTVGQTQDFQAITSLWFDPMDTTRWKAIRSTDTAGAPWKLRLGLDTTCPATGTVTMNLWRSVPDTLRFLLGDDMPSPDETVSGSCTDKVITATIGDSSSVKLGSTGAFGVRIAAPGFDSRIASAAYALDGVGDTLLPGVHDSRVAWGVRWKSASVGSIASSAGAGTRLRIRFDANSMRSHLVTSLRLPAAANDSFDNTVAVFSARATTRATSVTEGAARRLRLASWVVQSHDTTELSTSVGVDASKAFRSVRAGDGRVLEGVLHATALTGGLVRICLVSGSDSVPFLTRTGAVQYHFFLFPGESIEAPMYQDPGMAKFWFANRSGKVVFVRTVMVDGVAADDQIESYDENSYPVYRDEAVAVAPGAIRYEVRTAFNRILNRKAQEVWTDLYASAIAADTLIDDNFRLEVPVDPVDSATFLIRRRSQGVVQ